MTVEKTVGGFTSTVIPNFRRTLSGGGRNLVTASYSYTVNDVDSLSILYLATSDILTPTFALSSTQNYFSAPPSTTPSSSNNDTDDVNTTPVTTTGQPGDATGLIVVTIIVIFLLSIIGILSCLWQRCGKKEANNRVNPRSRNHVLLQGDIVHILPQEVVRKLKKCKEFNYREK